MTVSDARSALRKAKLRSTASRVAVLQHLSSASKPLSHADVADALVPEGFDKSTLYRCLIELADAGILSRLDAGDHAWRYELRRGDAHDPSEHPHFVCLDCGKIECLPDIEVRISPSNATKHSALGNVTEVFLKGRCKECDSGWTDRAVCESIVGGGHGSSSSILNISVRSQVSLPLRQ